LTTYCTSCGAQLSDGAAFCASCGTPVAGTVRMSATLTGAGETNGKAVASLVLGIGGFMIFPIGLAGLAIVLGGQAKREIRERGQGGMGLASAGVVLGWIGVGVAVIALMLFLVFAAAISSSPMELR